MTTKGNRREVDTTLTVSGSVSTVTQNVLGGTGWPTVEKLSEAQAKIESDSLAWLETCKALAQRRLPEEYFKLIPDDIWRFRIGNSKVVVMRTPQTEQIGRIALPANAQAPNEVGWILTVGPSIHNTPDANVRGREYLPSGVEYSDFVPLYAVGDLVLMRRHAGQPLLSSLMDESLVHRSRAQQFIIMSIADVLGLMVGVKVSDWSPVQETMVVAPERRIIS